MYKVVFLFGAGASYGAGGIRPGAPPLGIGLFDMLVRQYPTAWGALEPSVARRFQEEGFEAGMGWIWQNMPRAPQILQKCLGQFFCLFSVGDANANAYVRLLRGIAPRLNTDPIALATLNYEMVLEEAVSLVGLRWNYGDALAEGSQMLIIKPHGSCNFIPREVRVQHGRGRLVINTGIGIQSRVVPLWRRQALAYCSDPDNGLYPAIVAFMEGKPTQVVITFSRTCRRRSRRLCCPPKGWRWLALIRTLRTSTSGTASPRRARRSFSAETRMPSTSGRGTTET